MSKMTHAELAEYYNRTHDQSEFEGQDLVRPPAIAEKRNVILSIRLSAAELSTLSARAEAAGMLLDDYIRATSLDAGDRGRMSGASK